VIEHATVLLGLITGLDKVFEDLVLELSNKVVMNLKIDEAMAKICLKAVSYLKEILRFSKLLSLNV